MVSFGCVTPSLLPPSICLACVCGVWLHQLPFAVLWSLWFLLIYRRRNCSASLLTLHNYTGGGDSGGSGVFQCTPRQAGNAVFREQLLLGHVAKTGREIDRVVDQLRGAFLAKEYNIIHRNCNHFSDALSRALLGTGIPGWVNRLASFGSCCSCLLPPDLQGPSGTGSSSSAGDDIPLVARSNFKAFGGTGHSLAADSADTALASPSSQQGKSRSVNDSPADPVEERRRRAAAAALARLARSVHKTSGDEEEADANAT